MKFRLWLCLLCHILLLFPGTPQAKKAYFIAFTAYILCFFSGLFVFLGYVADIFSKTGSLLSVKNASLLVSITTLLGNLTCSAIVEKFNRRVSCNFHSETFTIFIFSLNLHSFRHFTSLHRCLRHLDIFHLLLIACFCSNNLDTNGYRHFVFRTLLSSAALA